MAPTTVPVAGGTTVTANSCSALPPAFVAVTVTVASPAATAVTVIVTPLTATVATSLSEEAAAYTQAPSPSEVVRGGDSRA